METLAILAIVGIFILGVGTAIWLMAKAVMAFFSSSQPERRVDPYAAYQPPPIPPPAPKPLGADRPTPRAEALLLVRRELMRAFNTGQIGKSAYLEMRRYIDQERELLDRPPRSKTEPLIVITPAIVAAESPPPTPPAEPEPVVVAASASVPAVAPLQELEPPKEPTPAPQPDVQPMRSPEQMRAAIARLHADAIAPEIPSPPPIVSSPKDEVAPSAADVVCAAPARTPLTPAAPSYAGVEGHEPPPKAAPKRPLWERIVERLFTPENVRILQSLAICLIFTSAVALVRQQMWSHASPWAQFAILIAGTAACSAVGFALRRWTELRITALCFLILGQLSILLDAYAALIGTDGRGVYPYSAESLWTICFALFAATALWQARSLKEPLFEAFAFFGALAAWGAGALWCGINHWLLPAAFIPAALLCGGLSRWLRPAFAVQGSGEGERGTLQRWSLPWRLDAAWTLGSGLLTVALPAAAVAHIAELKGCKDTVHVYWAHAGGMVVLALGLLVNACRKGHGRSVHLAAALLLFVWPLAEYAFDWDWQAWSMAFAVPGAVLALAGLFCERFVENYLPRGRNAALGEPLANWGLAATVIGVSLALCARVSGAKPDDVVWASGAATLIAVAFALLRNAAWAPWMATACAAFLASSQLDIVHAGCESWPVAWLALALLAHTAWTFLGKKNDVAAHGTLAADGLALAALAQLVSLTPILPLTIARAGVPLSLSAGWVGVALYALVTSAWQRGEWRRFAGVALLSPALEYTLYHAGAAFTGPAVWLAALAILVVVGASAVEAREQNPRLFHSALEGVALILVHGVCLAVSRCVWAEYLPAAQAFGVLAAAVAVLVIRLRVYWSAGTVELGAPSAAAMALAAGETMSLAFLAIAMQALAGHFHIHPSAAAFASALIAALVVAAALAGEDVAAYCARRASDADDALRSRRPFHTAGAIVALLWTVGAFLMLLGGSAWHMTLAARITAAWCAALLPLFIALRYKLDAARPDHDVAANIAGSILAAVLAAFATAIAVSSQFWLTSASPETRAACAVFFAVTLLVSVLCGLGLRFAFAPVTGTLALLGLVGCAYGAWHLPPESFGLCCIALAGIANGLAELALKRDGWSATNLPTALRFGAASVALLAVVHLLHGLVAWPVGAAQAWAVAGWLALAVVAWTGSKRSSNLALVSCLALTATACHVMRLFGLQHNQFGPGITGVALLLLAAREVVARFSPDEVAAADPFAGRCGGMLAGATVAGIAGMALGLWGGATGQPWQCTATLAEGALLLAALTVALRRDGWGTDGFCFMETGVLTLLALAGARLPMHLQVPESHWLLAAPVLAALTLLIALGGERLTAFCARNTPQHETVRPYHAAGAFVALAISALSLPALFIWSANWDVMRGFSASALSASLALRILWGSALIPLYIAVRHGIERTTDPNSAPKRDHVVFRVAGFVLSAFMTSLAAAIALSHEFWLTSTLPEFRVACALFFGAMLTVSVLCGGFLKRAFAPVTGMLALLGLAGCAYGAWPLPPESFGLCCALLVWFASGVAAAARKNSAFATSHVPAALQLSGAGVAAFAVLYLLGGLATWPVGAVQCWPVLGWLLLAAWAWNSSGHLVAAGRPRLATALSLGSGVGLTFAACHAMRWLGLDGPQVGPGLGAIALLLLALRELAVPLASLLATGDTDDEHAPDRAAAEARMRPQLNGLLGATFLTALASFLFAWIAGMSNHEWLCCITLLENALLAVALSVALWRTARQTGSGTARAKVFLLEMSVWALLAIAVGVAASPGAAFIPLSGPAWMLVAALFLVIGMALESIVSGLAQLGGTPAAQRTVPFLESRHVAAVGLTLLGLGQALFAASPFEQPCIQVTWRAIFCAAVLAVYGSLARWSADALRSEFARKLSAFAAYVVLLPAGYLCLLSAHATGSSWGALYFLALVPLLLGAAYVLEHEKLAMQAWDALVGAGLVSAGALALAFMGNRACLAAVPCATMLAIAVELLLLRAWCPLMDKESRKNIGPTYTYGLCLTLIGAANYGLRALSGWPAWGEAVPWAWQMPCLSVLGLAMTMLGGAWRLELLPASNGRGERNSVVALCGGWLSVATLALAFVRLLYYGMSTPSLSVTHVVYLDALIVAILLSAGTALAAGRWLGFSAARYVAPMGVIAAYALSVWKSHLQAWEWYSLPTALFLFIWAWQAAKEKESAPELQREQRHEVPVILTLASLLALLPSFIQAMPHTPDATWHFLALVGLSLGVVVGAMFARRKVPLLAGSSALVLGTVVKAAQWAQHREALLPVLGFALGFGVLAVAALVEQRMNQAFRKAVDRARAEAHMFWVSWQ